MIKLKKLSYPPDIYNAIFPSDFKHEIDNQGN